MGQGLSACIRRIRGSDEQGKKLINQEIYYSTDDDGVASVAQISKLSDQEIEGLSEVIVTKHMATIAIKYLGLPQETVENLRSTRHGDSTAFNRDVLVRWRNKNPRINQVKVSRTIVN